jgi:hypothetical protein
MLSLQEGDDTAPAKVDDRKTKVKEELKILVEQFTYYLALKIDFIYFHSIIVLKA